MKTIPLQILIAIFLLLPDKSKAQDTLKLYLNAGYVTSISYPSDRTRPDAGGSIRIGILTRGRLGFYTGYAWFKEYLSDFIEYDDKGSLYLAGLDIRLYRKGEFQSYVKIGAAIEKFISTYRTNSRTETETSVKPDLGLLFNLHHFNTYIGWQPSDPSHFNIGVGFTLYFLNNNKH